MAFVRAVGGMALALVILAWPDQSDNVLSRLLGLALIWIGIHGLANNLRSPRNWVGVFVDTSLTAIGAFLALTSDQPDVVLGRLLALAAGLSAARGIYRWFAARAHARPSLMPPIAYAASAILLAVFPDRVLATVTTFAALAWLGISALAIVAILDPDRVGTSSGISTSDLILGWLRTRRASSEDRSRLRMSLMFEGDDPRGQMIRFFTLMGFAAVLASGGVLSDSTAVVIGAMLVAPLMTPLMGVAMGLVMGWPNRLKVPALMALGGILFAITIGFLIGLLAPVSIDVVSNSQIASRVNPTMLDLFIAMAAGGAGAYSLSRKEVSDSLPGVAVAISLVPPLTVVGICISRGEFEAANGALLLFGTNALAILVFGGVTFVLTGVTPLQRVAHTQRRMQTAFAAVLVIAVAVLGGLFLNGAALTQSVTKQSEIQDAVTDWLGENSEHHLVDTTNQGDVVRVDLAGPKAGLGDPTNLAAALSKTLGRHVEVDIRLAVEERFVSSETVEN
jgi:uncharacterized hydrophobic protein (TIGR00271 family)